MKDTKRRIETFSFFDHTGIARHLENMAAKGWMIEKMANTGWVYRSIEPQRIHFSVSYYPKASAFDPEPTQDQLSFHDFCAHAGWELVCTSAQMQVFCNRRENPTPIQTEPALEVQSIHASAKRGFIPAHAVLLAVSLLNGWLWAGNFFHRPIEILSSLSNLISGSLYLLLTILCVVELICYFIWHSKAKTAAVQGEFLRAKGTSKFQQVMLTIATVGAIIWAASIIAQGHGWMAVISCLYMLALVLLVSGTTELLKRRKASRGVNRTVTILTSFFLAFAMMGLIVFGVVRSSSAGFFTSKDLETYEYNGIQRTIYRDELPLVLEDLMEVSYNEYIRERRGNMSPFVGHFTMRQYPRLDAMHRPSIPQLDYTMTIVNAPWLYDMCLQSILRARAELYDYMGLEYHQIDAEPWGAGKAYRMQDIEYGDTNQYLLCFDRVIAEVNFDFDQELTREQMAVVGRMLGEYHPRS